MAVFLIGDNGLERIGNEPIALYAGSMVHYGYSSDPDPVWIDSVTKDRVTFYRYPYGDKKLSREQLHLFRNIAQKGTQTKLAALKRYLATTRGDDAPQWLTETIEHYEAILAGKKGLTWDRDDIRMVKVEIGYTGTGDAWSEFERYYPHAVSGMTQEPSRQVLESYDFSKSQAAELCHRINIGELPGFEFIRSTGRDE